MIHFAFKVAAASGNLWSELVARESNSPYSHVEVWLDGPQNNARCFSSREPHGAGFEQIDLLDARLWAIVPLKCTAEQEINVNGYCLGADGKGYDGVGLLGYKLGDPALHDFREVFCSECAADIANKCCGKAIGGKRAWQISPGDLYTMAVVDFSTAKK